MIVKTLPWLISKVTAAPDVRATDCSVIALLKVTIPLAFAVSTLLASDAPSVVISR